MASEIHFNGDSPLRYSATDSKLKGRRDLARRGLEVRRPFLGGSRFRLRRRHRGQIDRKAAFPGSSSDSNVA